MNNTVLDEFCKNVSPEFNAIIQKIVASIQNSGHDLDMAVKWGQLTFAHEGDFHHWICAIRAAKKFVGLTFHFGGILNDPEGILMAGTSKLVRKIEYRHIEDVNAHAIQDFLGQALERLQYFKENWKDIQKNA